MDENYLMDKLMDTVEEVGKLKLQLEQKESTISWCTKREAEYVQIIKELQEKLHG